MRRAELPPKALEKEDPCWFLPAAGGCRRAFCLGLCDSTLPPSSRDLLLSLDLWISYEDLRPAWIYLDLISRYLIIPANKVTFTESWVDISFEGATV